MTVARFPTEFIVGEKISYSFGLVIASRRARRYEVAFNKNGHAFVVHRWVVKDAAETIPTQEHDQLQARSAHGESDAFKDQGKVPMGSHRERAGVLRGAAKITVTTPRANVEYRTPRG